MYFYVEPLNNISVGVIKSTFIYGKKKIIKKNAHFCYDSELLRTLSSRQGKNNLVLFDTGCLVLSGKYLSDLGTGPCRQCLDVFLTFLLMELSEDNKLCSTVSYHPPVSGSLLMMRVCDYCTGTEVLLEPLMCGRALSWRWDIHFSSTSHVSRRGVGAASKTLFLPKSRNWIHLNAEMGEIQETHDWKQICQQSRMPFSFVAPRIYRHSLLRSGVSVCAVKMNECQLDSIALRVCNEPRFCFFDLGGSGDKWRTHSLAIYEKMHDTHPHKQGHTHTCARACTHTHTCADVRGAMSYLLENMLQREALL